MKSQQYCFIFGKNAKLSLAELQAYFYAREIKFSVKDHGKQFAAIELENFDSNFSEDLGATLKICEVVTTIPKHEAAAMSKKSSPTPELEIFFDSVKEKLSRSKLFGVSVYVSDLNYASMARSFYVFLGNYLKSQSDASDTNKTKFMRFPPERKLPQLTNVEVIKSEFIEKSVECVAAVGDSSVYLCVTKGIHNPFGFQKRDIKKPQQRAILGISPRLAKAMINLSRVKPGQKLLDPFCGYGTILQEAVLMGINVSGSDVNPKCISASQENLGWLANEYREKQLGSGIAVKGDATKLESVFLNQKFDAIATEPTFGDPLNRAPTSKQAKIIIENLSTLYLCFLKSAKSILKDGGRIVMTTPAILTKEGKVVPTNVKRLAEESGLKIENPLEEMDVILDFDQRDKIRRQIVIFRK